MKIWIDAQFSPAIAAWINRNYDNIDAQSIRAVGSRDALDPEIFEEARKQNVLVMIKDDDFTGLVEQHSTPPQIIWVTYSNTPNAKFSQKPYLRYKNYLNREKIVEISDI